MTLSLAAAPSPAKIRAPRKELYDWADACQMLAPRQMRAHTIDTMRLPKISAHGIIMKFA